MSQAERNLTPSGAPVIIVEGGRPLADSRDVAAYFGKQHKDVLRAIRELACSQEFIERNFAPIKIKDLKGESTSHVLMTRNGFTFIVMGFTGEKAALFKEAWIAEFDRIDTELQQRPQQPAFDLNDPIALRTCLLTYAEKVIALEGQVAEMEPRVQALDRIAESDGSFCITDAAKTLQVRPKDLFDYLRQHGWIYKRPGTAHDVSYQSHLVSGDLEHKTTTVLRADGSEKTVTQVRVTPRGLTKLAKLLPPAASLAAPLPF